MPEVTEHELGIGFWLTWWMAAFLVVGLAESGMIELLQSEGIEHGSRAGWLWKGPTMMNAPMV